jgi:GT2 family glycosyltransferase
MPLHRPQSRPAPATTTADESIGSGLPTFSFIVPVRDDAERLGRCLQSIGACHYPPELVEVIVADNGSEDESPAVAAAAGARVLSLPGLRVAHMRNEAARVARGEVLAFVDADHTLDPGWLSAAAGTLGSDGTAAAGAPYSSPPGGTWVQRVYAGFRSHIPGRVETDWLASGNLAIWRARFAEIGGFDESLETCEDVDLCQRLRRAGLRVVSDSGMRSVHLGDPATLRGLFLSEMWRGRDNLRATLRGPLTLRALPSLLIPMTQLGLLALALAALLLAPWQGALWVSLASLAGIVAISGLQAARLFIRLPDRSITDGARAYAVALVYDLARAIALVVRSGHALRRRADRR